MCPKLNIDHCVPKRSHHSTITQMFDLFHFLTLLFGLIFIGNYFRSRCCEKYSDIFCFNSRTSSTDIAETEVPPHCHITIRCTREIAGFNGLGEAVKRLDFRSSVRDRRRFQYICALLRLLVAGKGISCLPGSAQRLLLQMLEEVASHGESKRNDVTMLHSVKV